MGLNAAAVQILVDRGLSAQDIADVMAACEKKKDNTTAERQARYRARQKRGDSNARNSNAVTPPIEYDHTPRDISSEDESHSLERDVESVLSVWRGVAKPIGLACWDKMTPKRRKSLKARLSDHGLQAIIQAIEHVPKSSFLRGEQGSWSGANLDFLMRPDTVPKILEGQYDDRQKNGTDRRGGAASGDGFIRALDRKLAEHANGSGLGQSASEVGPAGHRLALVDQQGSGTS